MANIVIGSVPIHGHVTPLLTVAAGLVERGHQVRFLPAHDSPTPWSAPEATSSPCQRRPTTTTAN